MKEVLNELLDVNVLWRELGLALKIRRGKLDEIGQDKHNEAGRMWETISYWLSGNGATPTSWRTLIAALRDPMVGEKQLADALTKKLTRT